MNVPRKVFLFIIALLVVGSITGIIIFTAMEQQARSALPPEERTAEVIETVYDGAVCLGCDFGRIFLAMFGSAGVVISLIAWGVYEVGRTFLAWHGSPDSSG